jgi:hypothetical protein
VFLVISVYFNLRNILPKSGTFLLGHPVYFPLNIYVLIVVEVVDRCYVMLGFVAYPLRVSSQL